MDQARMKIHVIAQYATNILTEGNCLTPQKTKEVNAVLVVLVFNLEDYIKKEWIISVLKESVRDDGI